MRYKRHDGLFNPLLYLKQFFPVSEHFSLDTFSSRISLSLVTLCSLPMRKSTRYHPKQASTTTSTRTSCILLSLLLYSPSSPSPSLPTSPSQSAQAASSPSIPASSPPTPATHSPSATSPRTTPSYRAASKLPAPLSPMASSRASSL